MAIWRHAGTRGEQQPVLADGHGLGAMREVLQASGSRAERDLWKAAPPVALLARVADLYRPLRPAWRTVAAAATLAAGTAAVLGILTRATRRSGH